MGLGDETLEEMRERVKSFPVPEHRLNAIGVFIRQNRVDIDKFWDEIKELLPKVDGEYWAEDDDGEVRFITDAFDGELLIGVMNWYNKSNYKWTDLPLVDRIHKTYKAMEDSIELLKALQIEAQVKKDSEAIGITRALLNH